MKFFLPIFTIASVLMFISCSGSTQPSQTEVDSLVINEVAQLHEVTSAESLQALADALKQNKPEVVKTKWEEMSAAFVSLFNSEHQTAFTSYAAEVQTFIENNAQALNDFGIDVVEIYDAASDALETAKENAQKTLQMEIEKIQSEAQKEVNDVLEQVKENLDQKVDEVKAESSDKELELKEKGKQIMDSLVNSAASKLYGG